MKTTIVYKGVDHYLAEVDPGGVTLKTISGNKIHRQQVASDDHDAPTRYAFTDWVSLPMKEFGQVLRENGFDREGAQTLFNTYWETLEELRIAHNKLI